MKKKRKREAAFTIVEILVVVAIIGIMALMVVPRLSGRTEAARRAAAQADIRANLAVALDLYELDNGAYPTTEQGLRGLVSEPAPAPPNWNGPYLKGGVPKDPWGNPYIYVYPGRRAGAYDLASWGGDGAEGGDDDIVNWETGN